MQQYFVNPLDNFWLYAVNTRRPLFSNLKLREAVNYAVDRTALAQNGGDQGPPRQPTDQYLPPASPATTTCRSTRSQPTSPRQNNSRQASEQRPYCTPATSRHAHRTRQILKNNLAAIGVDVQVHQFPYPVFYDLVNQTGPWDIADVGWQPDYPDPADFLNLLLEDGSFIPTFNDQAYRQRLTQGAELSGPTRYLTYGELARDLDRNAAPWIAYSNITVHSFFSSRVACQNYGVYGIDLAALCVRNPHEAAATTTNARRIHLGGRP